jgi:hypothetical protein
MALLGVDCGMHEDGIVADEEDADLSEDEVKELPDELRDILDVYEDIGKQERRRRRRKDVDLLNGI